MGHTLSSKGLEDTLLIIRSPWKLESKAKADLKAGRAVEKKPDPWCKMWSGRSRQNLLKGLVNDNRHYARDTVTQGLGQSILAAKELFIFLLFLAFLSMLHTGVRKSCCAATSGMGRSTQGGETPLKKGASSPALALSGP